MVFRLRGGPRDGQLVDELPPAYHVSNERTTDQLFDDEFATLAIWRPALRPLKPDQ